MAKKQTEPNKMMETNPKAYFLTRLRALAGCVSKDTTRLQLTGISIEKDEIGLIITACDGHKLVSEKIENTVLRDEWLNEKQIIIETASLPQLSKTLREFTKNYPHRLESMTFKLNEHCQIECSIPTMGIVHTFKVLLKEYPNYKSVIPTFPEKVIRLGINAENLADIQEALCFKHGTSTLQGLELTFIVDKEFKVSQGIKIKPLGGSRPQGQITSMIMPMRLF